MTNVFQGERVRLRAWESGDDAVFRHWDRVYPEGGRMLYEIRYPVPEVDLPPASGDAAAPSDNFPFTIATLDGVPIGAIHIQHSNPRCGTFSYGLAVMPPYRRKGYASEAVRLVLRHYFVERRYQKCSAGVFSFNEASMRLHERLGFTLEARLRRITYTEGEFYDVLFYGMTKEEFEAQKELSG